MRNLGLYYGNGGSAIAVAVADSPIGPFKDPLGKALVTGSTPGVQPFDGWLFDPMTFIDDDGQAYMYFGGNGDDNLRVIKLNEDMISVNGAAGRFTVPNFFEAAWLHKHNGKYYFSYSTNPSAGIRIDYMSSNSPMSGFTYGGIMSPQPPQNENNNHQAIFKMNNEWYQAYHNRVVAKGLGIDGSYRRNMAIDKFSHNADGSIKQMINTVDGIKQLMYLNPFERVEAETISNYNGIETEICNAGGMNLAYIDNGDWTMVEGVDFGTIGTNSFSTSVASNTTGGTLEIHLGSPTGMLIGTLDIPNTGGYQAWKTVKTPVQLTKGIHNIYFTFKGSGSGGLFNVDYWSFTEAAGAPEVRIISPTNEVDIFTGDETTIDVEVSDEDGTIANVFYYINNQLIQEEWLAPYAFTYVFNTSGTYQIKAIATDNDGNKKEDIITVYVHIPQGPYKGNIHEIPGIIQLEEFDVGGNEFAYLDNTPGSEVTPIVDFRSNEDVDIEKCADLDGGYNIGWATAGEWLEYTVNVLNTGVYDIELRVACSGDGRTISLEMDGNDITTDIPIPNTGGWQTWESVLIENVNLSAGKQILRLTIGDVDYINLNHVIFKDLVTGHNSKELSQSFIYPNPFSNEGFTIQSIEKSTYTIYDLRGRTIEMGSTNEANEIGKNLDSGMYQLLIESLNTSQSYRIIKQ